MFIYYKSYLFMNNPFSFYENSPNFNFEIWNFEINFCTQIPSNTNLLLILINHCHLLIYTCYKYLSYIYDILYFRKPF